MKNNSSYLKISIVTPSYNQAEFLEDAIKSVLSQGYPNLEYIVIDGGSTDGSVDIIKKYSDKLAYWVSEPDKGHGDALNKGFKQATGEIMAWINSDDYYFPWSLRVVSKIFSTYPQIEWLTTEKRVISDINGKPSSPIIFINFGRLGYKMGFYLIQSGNCIQQESTFWRRSLWERAGGYINKSSKLMPDFELWSRFWNKAELYSVDTPLGVFRRQEKQATNILYGACLDEEKKIFSKYQKRIFLKPLINIPKFLIYRYPILYYLFFRNNKRLKKYKGGVN